MIIEVLANTGRHCVRFVISRLFVALFWSSKKPRGSRSFIGTRDIKKTWLASSRRRWPRMVECPCSQGRREGTAGGSHSCTYASRKNI